MKNYFSLLLASAVMVLNAVEVKDLRPPLNKKDFQKTVWTQVNPWFPFDKQPIHDLGGPNIAYQKFTGKNIWGQGFKLLEQYGMDAIQVEINEPGGWASAYKTMLKEAKTVGSKIKLAMFFGCYSKTPEVTLKNLKKILGSFRDELKNHPNVMRVDGRPVVCIYNPSHYKPEQWKMIFDVLDKEFGPLVYLADTRNAAYLPVFDGVFNYGSNGLKGQKKKAAFLENVLKKDFPQKICDGGVHSTYTCHFYMGGLEVDLSRQYRESFDIYLKINPDSIHITNLFDHYENSLIFPCYEREDFMLRYMQYRVAKWRGQRFPALKTPELVVTNHIQILFGQQNLDFEIMGFPIDSEHKTVTVQLDICNTAGEVLHQLPAKKMELSDFRIERFSLPSQDFADERGVIARLTYIWKGRKYQMNYTPMTQISPSIRSYRMYWARSTKNELKTRGSAYWTMNNVEPGGTVVSDGSGISVFTGEKQPVWDKGDCSGCSRHGIKRDNLEFYFTKNIRYYLGSELALQTPNPGPALHWYYLEMENSSGRKWQSLPIWETDGSRAGKVTVPISLQNGEIRDIQIEGARVPFFYYPCNEEHHKLLLDVSGYMHHGSINGSGYGGGHLGYTGYNYYHNGPVAVRNINKQTSLFQKDPDGRGFLRFSGKDYVTIMGSTAFPGASTYELSVRPSELGKIMGLLGSGNNQIALKILPDGKVQVKRRSETEGMGGNAPKKTFQSSVVSKTALKIGQWTRIAVVYDCKELRLYLNGNLEGKAVCVPTAGHGWINHLIVGASNQWVWNPIEKFKGDLREIRIYGRNLSPEEFLKDSTVQKNPYEVKKVTEILISGKVQELTNVIAGEENGIKLVQRTSVFSRKRFNIDPNAEYIFKIQVKNTAGKGMPLYVGAFTGNFLFVHGRTGTETELLQPAKKGDKILHVRNLSGWMQKGWCAFGADRMEYDLPNKTIVPIEKIVMGKEESLLHLGKGAPADFAAGTLVRQHVEGATFNWAGSFYAEAGKEVSCTAKLKGISRGYAESGKFWPGSKTFQLVLAPIGPVSKEKPLLIRKITLEKITRVK